MECEIDSNFFTHNSPLANITILNFVEEILMRDDLRMFLRMEKFELFLSTYLPYAITWSYSPREKICARMNELKPIEISRMGTYIVLKFASNKTMDEMVKYFRFDSSFIYSLRNIVDEDRIEYLCEKNYLYTFMHGLSLIFRFVANYCTN